MRKKKRIPVSIMLLVFLFLLTGCTLGGTKQEAETKVDYYIGVIDDNAPQMCIRDSHQVRVRIHGTIARIEILPEEFPKLVEETNRNLITKSFKEYGFTYVTMDLTGYRTGSMNETLNSDL